MPRSLRLAALTVLALTGPFAVAQDEPAGRPIPLAGYERDVAGLAGEWVGGYEGSTRSGVVAFQLTSRQDTALGYVVMIPRAAPGARPRPVTLSVHFVWVEGGRVEGRMDRYADPELGVELETTFYGRLVDGRLAGSYESVGVNTDTVLQSGWWWAQPKTAL
jgi:hypothetical protein